MVRRTSTRMAGQDSVGSTKSSNGGDWDCVASPRVKPQPRVTERIPRKKEVKEKRVTRLGSFRNTPRRPYMPGAPRTTPHTHSPRAAAHPPSPPDAAAAAGAAVSANATAAVHTLGTGGGRAAAAAQRGRRGGARQTAGRRAWDPHHPPAASGRPLAAARAPAVARRRQPAGVRNDHRAHLGQRRRRWRQRPARRWRQWPHGARRVGHTGRHATATEADGRQVPPRRCAPHLACSTRQARPPPRNHASATLPTASTASPP